MWWTIVFLLAAVAGGLVIGLVRGFALAEANVLFPVILAVSAASLLANWGERSDSEERGR